MVQELQPQADVSVVIPCFRGETTIARLCERIRIALTSHKLSYEIILVDDSGRDALWNVIEGIAGLDEHIRAIRLSRNFGQHNATVTGFRNSVGRYVVSVDEDLQNPPEEIPRLLEYAKSNSMHLVYGIPKKRSGPKWRSLSSKLVMSVPRSVMGIDFDIAAFRLINGEIARKVAESDRHDIVLDIYLSWFTKRIGAVEVGHDSSELQSSYGFKKLFFLLIDLCCNYTVLPLRIIAVVGGALALASIFAALLVFAAHLNGYLTVPGWASITFTIFLSTGMILMALGIVAEYMARIFLRINGKPQSFVMHEVSHASRAKKIDKLPKLISKNDR